MGGADGSIGRRRLDLRGGVTDGTPVAADGVRFGGIVGGPARLNAPYDRRSAPGGAAPVVHPPRGSGPTPMGDEVRTPEQGR
ncbi:hypothetical protein GCM10027605_37570 [Micromonospora zhanjiangensis]